MVLNIFFILIFIFYTRHSYRHCYSACSIYNFCKLYKSQNLHTSLPLSRRESGLDEPLLGYRPALPYRALAPFLLLDMSSFFYFFIFFIFSTYQTALIVVRSGSEVSAGGSEPPLYGFCTGILGFRSGHIPFGTPIQPFRTGIIVFRKRFLGVLDLFYPILNRTKPLYGVCLSVSDLLDSGLLDFTKNWFISSYIDLMPGMFSRLRYFTFR